MQRIIKNIFPSISRYLSGKMVNNGHFQTMRCPKISWGDWKASNLLKIFFVNFFFESIYGVFLKELNYQDFLKLFWRKFLFSPNLRKINEYIYRDWDYHRYLLLFLIFKDLWKNILLKEKKPRLLSLFHFERQSKTFKDLLISFS